MRDAKGARDKEHTWKSFSEFCFDLLSGLKAWLERLDNIQGWRVGEKAWQQFSRNCLFKASLPKLTTSTDESAHMYTISSMILALIPVHRDSARHKDHASFTGLQYHGPLIDHDQVILLRKHDLNLLILAKICQEGDRHLRVAHSANGVSACRHGEARWIMLQKRRGVVKWRAE